MIKYSFALLAAIAAVEASPFPQAVTAAISPSGTAPSGCLPTYTGSFGVVNMNVTASAPGGQATQKPDGQPQAGSTVSGAVTQISDHQPQGGMTVAPVSMISDGQIQGGTKTQMMMPVTQISDGQVQGPTVVVMPASQITDGQPQVQPTPVTSVISEVSEGQPQAPTATGAGEQPEGQPTVGATGAGEQPEGQPTVGATGAGEQPEGQPTVGASGAGEQPEGQPTVGATGAGEQGEGQPTATAGSSGSQATNLAFCESSNTLTLTLSNGILKDSKGRTGYIASNYQFQFDKPPQAGAIYTAGFTVCGNGTLALGSSAIWYQCRSGSFFNLYDRNWAPQCSPVYIQTGKLVSCS